MGTGKGRAGGTQKVGGWERDRAGAFVGTEPAEREVLERGGEEMEVGVQEFEMVGGGGGVRWDAVHVDGERADLLPAFGGIGTCAEAGGGV